MFVAAIFSIDYQAGLGNIFPIITRLTKHRVYVGESSGFISQGNTINLNEIGGEQRILIEVIWRLI